LLVLLNPLRRDTTPRTAKEIDQRISELAFSANFMREMQSLARASRLHDGKGGAHAEAGRSPPKRSSTRVHMIDISDLASLQRTDTQALAHPPFLELLRNQGQERARGWLAAHGHAVGQHSTVDVQQLFG
jgi:NTE family protein